jgi:hypothetical protein
MNPHQVTKDFERALCEYTGAPYCVTVKTVSIPRFTYISVPMSIVHAGGIVVFDDREWKGSYSLNPYPIRDSARRFTSGMYGGGMECVSFHWSKILGLQQGGAILHDDPEADAWLRKARFDGRTEGVAPKDDTFIMGWHCYLSPEIAAQGIMRLCLLPKHNEDLPNDDYPDLSKVPLFQRSLPKYLETMVENFEAPNPLLARRRHQERTPSSFSASNLKGLLPRG